MDKPKPQDADTAPGASESGMPIVLTPEQARAQAARYREEANLADVEDDFTDEERDAIIGGSDDD